MVIGGGQRLLLRLSERCNEAPCHGSVRVSYPTYIMHENFRLCTYEQDLAFAMRRSNERDEPVSDGHLECEISSRVESP